MFAYMLFDWINSLRIEINYTLFGRLRTNTDIYLNIRYTLFERTNERSLDAILKMRVLLPSHVHMLANNITMHGVSKKFDLSSHMFAQIESNSLSAILYR